MFADSAQRLLKAHRETETDLTKDAQSLKRTIEGAIADIDELHAGGYPPVPTSVCCYDNRFVCALKFWFI